MRPKLADARVERVFGDAVDLPAEKRAAFLDGACGEDSALRAEVESLLAADDSAHRFLDPPAADRPDPNLGSTVGAWKLLREIGAGGMGSVYLAERADAAFEQRAAVKLIRAGLHTRELLRRFDHERRVLAALEHANIARLIDGGATDDGTPFLVMEYVDGTPIDRYCDEGRLSITARLRLFQDVCAAVQHAHRNLVVHRDLKPSNILVTGEGAVKLLDFGIAKVMETDAGGALTKTGERAMTPRYASPEQIRYEPVTTASDVYSLGVILFELLTGGRPYDMRELTPAEMERVVTETEPTRPSAAVAGSPVAESEGGTHALARRLSGDLDNVVLMAMRKEPARRYATVEQFSDDVRRHLEGFPVRARSDTVGYRAAKFVRRNTVLVAAGAALAVALVAGAAVSLHFALGEGRQRAVADARFEEVRALASKFLTEVDGAIANEGKTAAREKIVSTSLEYLDNLAAEPGEDVRVLQDVARGYFRVAAIQGDPKQPNLGDTEAALRSAHKGQQVARHLAELDPEGRGSRLIAVEADLLAGDLSRHAGDGDATIRHFEAALEKRLRLSEEDPEAELQHPRLDTVHFQLAYALERLQVLERSIEHFERASTIEDELIAAHPEEPGLFRSKAVTLTALSQAYRFHGMPEKTVELLAPLRERLAAEAEVHAELRPTLANLRYNLGWTYVDEGDTARGVAEIQDACAFYAGLAEADPGDVTAHRNTAATRHDLGELEAQAGRPGPALEHYEELLRLRRHIVSLSPESALFRSDLATALAASGEVLWQLDRKPESLERLTEAGALFRRLATEQPEDAQFGASADEADRRAAELRGRLAGR